MPDAPRSAVNSLAPGIPLWRKLGIREGWRVALVGAPEGFEVENLPAGVEIRRSARGSADLTVWFVSMAPRARSSGLWIAWPKRASPLASDLTDEVVRRAGIDHGLVDFKVCAIDSDWSGLRFNLLVTHLTRSDERGTT
jgi:hypothetical protein